MHYEELQIIDVISRRGLQWWTDTQMSIKNPLGRFPSGWFYSLTHAGVARPVRGEQAFRTRPA